MKEKLFLKLKERDRNHHHFYCKKCGEIYDFNSPEFDDLKIPNKLKRRFEISGKKLCSEEYIIYVKAMSR